MTFQTMTDLDWQVAVGDRLREKLGAELHPFGPLDEVDGWIEKGQHVVGVCEIKRRYVNRSTYPTIWVSLRKWTGLMLIGQAFGVSGIFIVHYDDQICWLAAADMAGLPLVIGAREDRGVANDREPVIDVPTHMLRTL